MVSIHVDCTHYKECAGKSLTNCKRCTHNHIRNKEVMAIQKKNFREQLVDVVKAAGQEVIDRAEELVGQGELMTDFDIWLRFPLDGRMFTACPTIEVTKSYVNKKSCDVMFGEAK